MELLTQVKDYSSLKLFDLRSESGHSGLLYQILYKCDLPGEGSPDKGCRCKVVDWRFDNLSGGHPT